MSITAMYVLIIMYDANIFKDIIKTLLCIRALKQYTQSKSHPSAYADRNEWNKVVHFLF